MDNIEENELLEIAYRIVLRAFGDRLNNSGRLHRWHLENIEKRVDANDYDIRVIALLNDLLEHCPEWNDTTLRHIFPSYIVDSIVALRKKENQTLDEYMERVSGDYRGFYCQ